MKAVLRLLGTPLTRDQVDARVSRWICFLCGLAQLCLATVFFVRHAHDGLELALGVTLSFVVFALVVLCGVLTSRLAMIVPMIPLRLRLVELAGYALGIVILVAGCSFLSTLSLERVGVTMGLLVMLGLSMSSICVGAWWTCRRISVGRAS